MANIGVDAAEVEDHTASRHWMRIDIECESGDQEVKEDAVFIFLLYQKNVFQYDILSDDTWLVRWYIKSHAIY